MQTKGINKLKHKKTVLGKYLDYATFM